MPDSTTIPDLLISRTKNTPYVIALNRRSDDGSWCPVTWTEYLRSVSSLARTLGERGLAPGDAVGILGPSRVEWDIAQSAILACGGIVVGLDVYDTADHIGKIVEHSNLIALIVLDDESVERISEAVRERFRFILTVERAGRSEAGDLEPRNGQPGAVEAMALVNRASADDPAFIVFTSGTTGDPKGIVYTHRQVCLAVDSILSAFHDIRQGDRLVCWLPLSNLFQRMVNFCAVARCAITYYVEDPRNVVSALGSINPHIFVAVPRFYEKLYSGIMERIGRMPSWQRRLVHWALGVGDTYARAMRKGRKPPIALRLFYAAADRLVLMRIRATLGSNLRYLVSGSAPMPQWLLERYHAMGLLILEAYGLSENIVPMAANRLDSFKFGTVGQPLVHNEIKADEDGQLLVRGPGVCSGYYGEQGSNHRFGAEGFYATGDFGEIDQQGFITLRGRTGDIIKTSTGRRVAPVAIEQSICRVPYVEHAVTIGASRQSITAILSVSVSGLESHVGVGQKLASKDLLHKARLAVSADVAHAVEHLALYQRPVGILVTARPFTLEGGELTSNQKVRRRAIEEKYARHIDALYTELETSSRLGPADHVPHVVVVET